MDTVRACCKAGGIVGDKVRDVFLYECGISRGVTEALDGIDNAMLMISGTLNVSLIFIDKCVCARGGS